MNYKYISIIICCYNSSEFIIETLDSVKKQTYKNYEIIIIDDGSSDNTVSIVNNYINQNPNLSINLFIQKNLGLPLSRNNAIAKSSYDLIAILDHDDLWEPNKLSEQIKQINENKNCVLFFSDFSYLNYKSDDKTRFETFKVKDNYLPYKLNLSKINGFINLSLFGCFIGSSTVIFKKEIINKIGNFNSNYSFLTDYIFFLEISKNFDIHCSNLNLSKWRFHNNNATLLLNKIYVREMNRLFLNLFKSKLLKFTHKIKILIKYIKFNIKNVIS